MNIEEKIQDLGLSKKESEIYFNLLKYGCLSAKEISKKVNILRSSIYDYLETLIEKGFISYTFKDNVKHYQAINPNKLHDNFLEKKEKEEEALKEIIKGLNKINKDQTKSNIEILEGREGLKSAMFNILKQEITEIFITGSSKTLSENFPLLVEKWNNLRISRKIKLKMIYNNVLSKQDVKKRKMLFTTIKYIDQKEISFSNTIIYKNNILVIIIDKENPISIHIENENVYNTYKNNFNQLWNISKEYK
jgi:sugar-specific transcriptional regulator TrmB